MISLQYSDLNGSLVNHCTSEYSNLLHKLSSPYTIASQEHSSCNSCFQCGRILKSSTRNKSLPFNPTHPPPSKSCLTISASSKSASSTTAGTHKPHPREPSGGVEISKHWSALSWRRGNFLPKNVVEQDISNDFAAFLSLFDYIQLALGYTRALIRFERMYVVLNDAEKGGELLSIFRIVGEVGFLMKIDSSRDDWCCTGFSL